MAGCMEIANLSIQTAPSNQTGNNKHKRIQICALIAVIILVGATTSLFFFSSTLFPKSKPNTNALSIGAYANYYGETAVLGQTVGMQMREEIVELNSTQVKILTHVTINSNLAGKLYEYQNTSWMNITEKNYNTENMILLNKVQENVNFPNIGNRDCIVYEYQSQMGDTLQGTMTVYVDKNLDWPYEFAFDVTTNGMTIQISLLIQDTNVQGLK
jgi:hypothetical protein